MNDLAVLDRPTTGRDLGSDREPSLGNGRMTHIIAGTEKTTGAALVTEARVFGSTVTALCGYVWTPGHDPKQYPICSKCLAIREEARPDQDPFDIPAA